MNTGQGAVAAWLRTPDGLSKILVLVPHIKPQEGELLAGLLGLVLWHYRGAPSPLIWNLDNPHLVERLKARVSEPLFLTIQSRLAGVSVQHVRAHAGIAPNEACDRACRWGVQKGESLLGGKEARFVGQGPDPWLLFDARSLFKEWERYVALTEVMCERYLPALRGGSGNGGMEAD